MEFIKLAAYDNYMLANMTLGLLQQNDINCHLDDEHTVTIDPLLNHAIGGIKLMVATSQLDRATALIKEAENQYLQEISCPHCQNKTLQVEEKTNTPTLFWQKLKNQIAYGQTSTYSKKYRCSSCKGLFDELPLSY
jgi:DNA-directed RNA polymerase subunit RPC12/RpoP